MNAGVERDDSTEVVYIDDHIEAAGQLEDAFDRFTKVDLQNPGWEEELERAIPNADLIITDWKLDKMVKGKPFSPGDGKALNELIRAKRRTNPNNPLYTIFSGKLSEVPDFEHHADRPHILAQDLDADWVGSKDKGSEFRRQLLLLCRARRTLRSVSCEPAKIGDYWRSLFNLGSIVSWSEDALSEIERFQPPVHHLYGERRDERIFLRWMTRVVLPYPTFLLDAHEVAIRLRIDPVQTARMLADDSSAMNRALIQVRYGGILAGFASDRWWRPGLDDWLWTITAGNPYDRGRLQKELAKVAREQLKFLEERDPVLLRDERGRRMEDDLIADASEAVRIQPDEWPASVPWPWARIATVLKEPKLRAIVLPDDQHVLTRKG
jgi:hypothetical protein